MERCNGPAGGKKLCDLSLADGARGAIGDAEGADHLIPAKDRNHDGAGKSGGEGARPHVSALVGLDVAGIDRLPPFNRKPGHALADRDGPDRLEHDLREAGSGSGEVEHAIIADEMNGAAVGTKVPHDGRERIAV